MERGLKDKTPGSMGGCSREALPGALGEETIEGESLTIRTKPELPVQRAKFLNIQVEYLLS